MTEEHALVTWAGSALKKQPPSWPAQILPWRERTTPYRVFVAEFLLVRTRADVVARLFEDIVAQFPDLEALAQATPEELLATLNPLGLRKRVPLLRKAASYIVERCDGVIPSEPTELEKIPGVGPYTASAIAAFAFDSGDVPADVNVFRLISRLTGLPMIHATKGSPQIRELTSRLSRDRGGPDPEVLLDFSRLICRPREPNCDHCPLVRRCAFAQTAS